MGPHEEDRRKDEWARHCPVGADMCCTRCGRRVTLEDALSIGLVSDLPIQES